MKVPYTILCLLTLPAFAAAQEAILFTGRFPFVNLDAATSTGSVVQMSEFDFSYSLPLPGLSVARTLMPETAMHCYLGDGNSDGNYLKFSDWKTSYFSNIGIDGVFVKDADQSDVTWDKVYWTPRLDLGAAPPLEMEVLTNNGTPTPLSEGDWVRFLPNGNVEFFMTAAQFAIACGAQSGAGNLAAGALVQTSNGDLFYAPADGGHWVNGNSGVSVFAQDGAICKIDAANITYDANGNVASFAPDSARVLINESTTGPNGVLTVRMMVDNSGAMDRTGVPILTAGVYGKTGGLGLDPNGGTWTPMYPDIAGNFPLEPNLVFCSNAGSYGGTIWTTMNNGEVAQINFTQCGSTTPGVPADGSWLGVQLDVANFQPTLLGMTIIGLPQDTPLICDQSNAGSLDVNTNQPNWEIDFFGLQNMAVFALTTIGPQPPATVVPSLPLGLVPLGFTADSWDDLFLTTSPLGLGVTITDAFGYGTVSLPNFNNGNFPGATLTVQGLGLHPNGFQLSSPIIVQLQ